MQFKFFLGLIFIVFFLTACDTLNNLNIFNSDAISSGKGLNVAISAIPPIQGKTLNEGNPFSVKLGLTNYMLNPVQGRVCLRDKTTDTFGGIPSSGESCQNFNLGEAEVTKSNGQIFPDSVDYYFPRAGEYSYRNMDEISLSNQIFVDLYYTLETVNGVDACIEQRGMNKCEQTQSLNPKKSDAPLGVSKVTVTQSYSQKDTILNAEIILNKQEEGELLTSDSTISDPLNQKVFVDVEINRMLARCNVELGGYVVFKKDQNEKVIKCNLPLSLQEEFVNVPITVKMKYTFKKTINGPSFDLKKEEMIV